jgi:hypothetical protein
MSDDYKPYYYKYHKLEKGIRPWLPYRVYSESTTEVVAACNLKRTAIFVTGMLNFNYLMKEAAKKVSP